MHQFWRVHCTAGAPSDNTQDKTSDPVRGKLHPKSGRSQRGCSMLINDVITRGGGGWPKNYTMTWMTPNIKTTLKLNMVRASKLNRKSSETALLHNNFLAIFVYKRGGG